MSYQMIPVCDCCEQPIKSIPDEYYDAESGETIQFETFLMARTKVWNTKSLYPHLCINCANKIDQALEKFQRDMNTLAENAKLNKQRREQLNSKG